MYRCPKCKNNTVTTERRPDGDSVCQNCNYKDKTKNFTKDPDDFIEKLEAESEASNSNVFSYLVRANYVLSKYSNDYELEYKMTFDEVCIVAKMIQKEEHHQTKRGNL